MSLRDIEEKFILTGTMNLSEFFKVNRESKNEKVHFDMIKPSELEWHNAEYQKEIKVFNEAWVESVLK